MLMRTIPIFITISVFPLFLAVNMTGKNLAFHQLLAADFVKENQAAVRGGGDERWMFKFMNANSIIPPETTPSASQLQLSDASSAELMVLSDSTTASCASGWTQYSGTGDCYMESSTTMSWYEAEAWCWSQRAGAHLASVHSQAEAVWLNAQYKVWYLPLDDWIGMRRDCDNVTYIWTDGTPVDFQWWQPSYPQSAYAEESCTTIWNTVLLLLISGYVPGQFDDMKNCGEGGSSALCKYDPTKLDIGEPYTGNVCTTPGAVVATTTTPMETTTTTTTTTTTSTTTTTTTTTPTTTTTTVTTPTTTTPLPPLSLTTILSPTTTPFNAALCPISTSCPANWIEYNSKCYVLLSAASPATYSQAVLGCQSNGASLVEIASSDENEALRKAFSTNLEPTSSSITSQAWIGNSTSSYSNWAAGEGPETDGYCGVFALSPVESLGYSRGVWADELCSSTQQYAICSVGI